jgi:hypothetical protein
MLQKFLKIRASKEDFLDELMAFEKWPDWWPGAQKVVVVKKEPTVCVIDLTMKAGTTVNMTLEYLRVQDNLFKFRQTKGWFKSYSGDWTIMPPPDGVGIIWKVAIVLDPGMMVPKSMIYAKFGETLDLVEQRLNQRLQGRKPATAPGPAEAVAQRPVAQAVVEAAKPAARAKKLAHVFQTKQGLEVWVSGRRHLIKAVK